MIIVFKHSRWLLRISFSFCSFYSLLRPFLLKLPQVKQQSITSVRYHMAHYFMTIIFTLLHIPHCMYQLLLIEFRVVYSTES